MADEKSLNELLDEIENSLDNAVTAKDIEVVKRLKTLIGKYTSLLDRMDRAKVNTQTARSNLKGMSERIDAYLREFA